MSKLKSTKRPNPYARKIVVPFKVNPDEMREIFKKSLQFTKGNVSEWVRCAALKFKPTKEDFEK